MSTCRCDGLTPPVDTSLRSMSMASTWSTTTMGRPHPLHWVGVATMALVMMIVIMLNQLLGIRQWIPLVHPKSKVGRNQKFPTFSMLHTRTVIYMYVHVRSWNYECHKFHDVIKNCSIYLFHVEAWFTKLTCCVVNALTGFVCTGPSRKKRLIYWGLCKLLKVSTCISHTYIQ